MREKGLIRPLCALLSMHISDDNEWIHEQPEIDAVCVCFVKGKTVAFVVGFTFGY